MGGGGINLIWLMESIPELHFISPSVSIHFRPEGLAEGSTGMWTVVLLNPRKALALCACGTVAASLAAQESMDAQRHNFLVASNSFKIEF